jgi:hypothetical protein
MQRRHPEHCGLISARRAFPDVKLRIIQEVMVFEKVQVPLIFFQPRLKLPLGRDDDLAGFFKALYKERQVLPVEVLAIDIVGGVKRREPNQEYVIVPAQAQLF